MQDSGFRRVLGLLAQEWALKRLCLFPGTTGMITWGDLTASEALLMQVVAVAKEFNLVSLGLYLRLTEGVKAVLLQDATVCFLLVCFA